MGIRDTERLSKMIRSCNVQYFTLALLHRRKQKKKLVATIAGFFCFSNKHQMSHHYNLLFSLSTSLCKASSFFSRFSINFSSPSAAANGFASTCV